MNKILLAVVLGILLLGCVQQQQDAKFVCPDGTTVDDKSQCIVLNPSSKISLTPEPSQEVVTVQATPTPMPTPGPTSVLTVSPTLKPKGFNKCFSSSDCFFSGSICTSRLNAEPASNNGQNPKENFVCICNLKECVEKLHLTPTPTPTPTPVPEEIGLSSINVSSITFNSADVTWTTAREATSHVRYGTSPNVFSGFRDEEKLVTDHWIPLAQLNLYKMYYFEVTSCKKDSPEGEEYDCETSQRHNFTTLESPLVPYR
ncbi:MAG: hypothetical protein ACE5DI_03430 [Candidatus Micrarchaeia archaeon]